MLESVRGGLLDGQRGDTGEGRSDGPQLVSSELLRLPDDESPPTIFRLATDCRKRFKKICTILQELSTNGASDRGYERDTALILMQDGYARYNAWGTNIAAFHHSSMKTSLDFRLKEAVGMRERALRILEDLQEYLYEANLIITSITMNKSWESGELSDESEYEDDEEKNEGNTSELQELFSAIKSSNMNLMKLSMVVRSSPVRDDYFKAASRYRTWNPYPDIGHVKEKHGSAKGSNDWLLERLGKAITRRRQFLKYRVEHHERLTGVWGDEEEKDDYKKPEKTIASTKATTFIAADNVLQKEESYGPASFGSQTSYEATVAEGEEISAKLSVPNHPTLAFPGVPFEFGEPFQCPYCFTEQRVQNKAGWKKHVFHDLKPYVCTFKTCEMRMFRSRNEWFAHELQNHRREWVCQYCQHETFKAPDVWADHMKSSHPSVLANSQLEALMLQSEEPIDHIPASACPLCDDWEEQINKRYTQQTSKIQLLNNGQTVEPYSTVKQFRTHLGRHMQQLALFALPKYNSDELNDDSADGGEDISNSTRDRDASKSTEANMEFSKQEIKRLNLWDRLVSLIPSSVSSSKVVPTVQAQQSRIHSAITLLDPSYQVRSKDYKDFFQVGRVFSILWSEPIIVNVNDSRNFVSEVAYGENAFTKIRRFVVVRQQGKACSCLPVTSYEKGVNKAGIVLADHGFIYSSTEPAPVKGLGARPLKMILSQVNNELRDPSLINYSKVYNVYTHLKVKDFGYIDPDPDLLTGVASFNHLDFWIGNREENKIEDESMSAAATREDPVYIYLPVPRDNRGKKYYHFDKSQIRGFEILQIFQIPRYYQSKNQSWSLLLTIEGFIQRIEDYKRHLMIHEIESKVYPCGYVDSSAHHELGILNTEPGIHSPTSDPPPTPASIHAINSSELLAESGLDPTHTVGTWAGEVEQEKTSEESNHSVEDEINKQVRLTPDPANVNLRRKIDPDKPTYARISRKYLSIETLNTYNIDWDFDPDSNYVCIKRWVLDDEQDALWEHSRMI
ncbi:hypothetical protein B7463_g2501, partial [Scytalidium lignicola]